MFCLGKKSSIDRTTRIVSTITLSGALFLIFKSIFMFWFNTFNSVLYSGNFFSLESTLPILLLSIGLRLGYGVIKYLYYELKSFINEEDIKNYSIERSNKSFKDLFMIINSAGYSLGIFGIIYTSIEDIKFLITFSIMTLLLVIIFIAKRRLKNKKMLLFSPMRETIKRINIKGITMPEWVNICYIFFLVFIISMGFSITSFSSSNQQIDIKYTETSAIPVEIILQNFNNPLVAVNIKDSNGNSKHQLILKHNSYTESYSASIESDIVVNEEDFLSLLDKLTDNVKKFYIPDIVTKYYYNTNLGELIDDGTYIIEITAISIEDRETEVKSFTTTLAKEKSKIFIQEKEYNSK